MTENKYQQLLDSLTFEMSYENCNLVKFHFEKIVKLLNKHVSLTSKKSCGIFNMLPKESVARLILSPNVCETLYLLEKGEDYQLLYKQLECFILSEGALKELCPSPIEFTSMSDHCFIKGNKYQTITLDCGIQIDYNGLFHLSESGYSLNEGLRFKEILNRAFIYIRETCPITYEFVLANTIMISLFRDSKRFQTNFSSDIAIGKIHSLNFDRIANNLDEVIDFIIHETIHNFLHLVEEFSGQFLSDEILKGLKGERLAKSPWTGNMICPQSYTHAVCVWFGLANFWKKANNKEYMYDESIKGFCSNNVLSGLKEFRHNIDTDYICTVSKMTHFLECKNVA